MPCVQNRVHSAPPARTVVLPTAERLVYLILCDSDRARRQQRLRELVACLSVRERELLVRRWAR